MPKTEVQILGQKYLLKGEASEEHMQALARYVDDKIREVLNGSPGMHPTKAAILAALEIADELYRLRLREQTLQQEIAQRASMLAGLLD
jgi:cell division protein ZapA